MREAAHALRFQVYCLERNFENAEEHPDGLEIDSYDTHAVQGVLFHRPTRGAIGSVRMILPEAGTEDSYGLDRTRHESSDRGDDADQHQGCRDQPDHIARAPVPRRRQGAPPRQCARPVGSAGGPVSSAVDRPWLWHKPLSLGGSQFPGAPGVLLARRDRLNVAHGPSLKGGYLSVTRVSA